jgi:hypothetical protein
VGGLHRWLALSFAGFAVLGGCSQSDESASRTPPPSAARGVEAETTAAPSTATTTATASAPTTSATVAAPATTRATPAPVATTTTTAPLTDPPGFAGTVNEIDAATAARMTASWRPGCPVPLRDLRLVAITYWGFDGQPRPGELVVHATQAARIRRVFAELFAARFPIEQVRLVDEFGGDDDRSMAANNTSAFNCRRAFGSTRWSQHAYGKAIDVNPLRNPYVTRSGVYPPGGREFIRRDGSIPGVITARGPVVQAFGGIGWRWGGAWANPDYQHFSASGG